MVLFALYVAVTNATCLLAYSWHPANDWFLNSTEERWAIICSSELKKTTLTDLLTSRLSSDHSFEMVERASTDALDKELQLATFLADDATRQRLDLASRLSADRLLFLSSEYKQGVKTLRVVICDSQTGVRLLDRQFSVEELDTNQISEVCENLAITTKQRFSTGIKAVVGVAPFKSENLTREFDRLQNGYASLLRSALLDFHGIAAIELKEAQAIRRELAISKREKQDRIAVTLIDGSFKVESKTDGEPLVTISWNANLGEKVTPNQTKPMTLEQAPRFFTDTLPEIITSDLNLPGKGIPEYSQSQWLSEQADSFSLRGNLTESTSLREAALLLAPMSVELRRKNIEDYIRICGNALEDESIRQQQRFSRPQQRTISISPARTAAFVSYLDHLEFLIRNRLVSANEAIHLLQPTDNFYRPNFRYVTRDPQSRARIQEVDFYLKTSQLILDLPRNFEFQQDPNHPEEQSEFLLRAILHGLQIGNFSRPFDQNVNLNHVAEILTNVIPEGSVLPDASYFLSGMHPHTQSSSWDAFVRRLAESKNENAQIFGRYAQLKSNLPRRQIVKPGFDHPLSKLPRKEIENLIASTRELIADYDSLPYSTDEIDQSNRKFEPIRKDLAADLKFIESATGPNSDASNKEPRNASGIVSFDREGAAGTVRHSSIKIQLHRLDKTIVDFVDQKELHQGERLRWRAMHSAAARHPRALFDLSLTRCGDIDVWWNAGTILRMRTRGVLEEVIVDPAARISDVCWDGENIWIASQTHGIGILKTDSASTDEIFEAPDGLPPSDVALKIISILPGKILAVGAFGKSSRAWCATVEIKNETLHSDIFHQATIENMTGDRQKRNWSDTKTVFYPAWIARFENHEGETRFLIGRAHDLLEGSPNLFFAEDHRPLLVEPNSKSITVFDREMLINTCSHGFDNDQTFATFRGKLFRARRHTIRQIHAPTADKSSEWKRFENVGDVRKGFKFAKRYHPPITNLNRLLKKDGSVYFPGIQWLKLNMQEMDCQRFVAPGEKPACKMNQFYGESAHYGFIGWNNSYHQDSFDFTRFELIPGVE